jgi:oligopeptide transport system substrate-binding protein
MFKVAFRTVPVVALVAVMVLALVPAGFVSADDASVTLTAQYLQDDLVVLDLSAANEISTLDPALASDTVSITPIENLFHGLTDVDPISAQVTPELATSWETNEDGTVWTFNLRDDVMWMRYDPASDTAEAIRPVVAQDFVYGIKRACDPRGAAYYGTIAAQVIAGCEEVNGAPESDVTDELVYGDTTKVSAPDDTTLVIELQFAAGYFFSMTPMWMLRATPQEAIDEFGDEWTAPGNIVTNGPYFVKENTRGVRRVFVRNYDHNADLDYGGNIDVINYTVIEDGGTVFALYQDSQIDAASVPVLNSKIS